ncbi:MAG: GlmL-related ornithine degradation protein [Bacillota bacterium]
MNTQSIDCLIAEIGSTTTIVTAIDNIEGNNPHIIAQGQALTTVADGDVTIGLHNAIAQIECALNCKLIYREMLAASSAAGGLRMTVHGLVYDMTVKAAKEAVLGAGANIQLITAGDISERELLCIVKIQPNIMFLAGGVDYGEQEITLRNAEKLARLPLIVPTIYAGNCALIDDVKDMFAANNKELICVENVYPRIDALNVDAARLAIQAVFEKHIIHAPGMNSIRDMVTGNILPVPGAVMNAAKLLRVAIGDLLVIDIGGATTDVHSVTDGDSEISSLLINPEPTAKRTVEGDLGMFINAANVINLLNPENIFGGRYNIDELIGLVVAVPQTAEQLELAECMADIAARTALVRHSGSLEYIYGVSGRKQIARGKDLTAVKWIVGTGGALTKLDCGQHILQKLNTHQHDIRLLPRSATVLIDHDYVMASAGVLAYRYPKAALALLKSSLRISLVEVDH